MRGQFGHCHGALIPGVLAAFCLTLQNPAFFNRAVVLGALGFSLGGNISYGRLMDAILATQSPAFLLPAFAIIFLIGAVWGGLGCFFLGFAFSEKSLKFRDIIFLTVTAGVLFFLPDALPLDPYDLGFLAAGFVLIHLYNHFFHRSRHVMVYGLYGFAGFGAAFLAAVLLLYWGFSLRDQIIGFLAGLTLWMIAKKIGNFQAPQNHGPDILHGFPWGRAVAMIFVPAINTADVFNYWFLENQFSLISFYGAFILICFLILIYGYFKKSKIKNISTVALFFVLYLTPLAIAKSIFVRGWGGWETAFTLFLIFDMVWAVYERNQTSSLAS
ncbi:MAG: hypothetical protein HYZ83_04615 [Candidatus Omnitrophica bacterium]|nr:hypothetical protein [Candidatus Omnitrophota bacterium]